ncbi:hypothetical protein OSC52_16620 [Clostridium pasteurianum]|uniref:hypothetical protein n=1 Tax=Clostridium pasteurianum TaxID=1501 RepID=UPI002260AB1C|nr:hypothetical protein [Clostridium pasteurianum]UZW13448.1 hypothetical protein OSC52_16620 [Clostridium pasteurianum]
MDDRIERYKQIRRTGYKIVNNEIMKFANKNYKSKLITESAKKLGILEGKNKIVLDWEEENQYFLDFVINETKINGKKLIQCFSEKSVLEGELEIEFMDAMKKAYTSLFRVVNTSPEKGLVFIKDLLGDGKNIRLTDLGLSQMKDKNLLIFTRIIPFKDMNITSGMTCAFHSNYEMDLMDLYKNYMKNISSDEEEKKFIFFYNVFKEIGIGTFMQEV